MTVTTDPHHPRYLEEADVRAEMTRQFDVCQSCRRCTDLCGSFPTLFDMLDRHDDRDAGRLTPAQQDAIADLCFQCKLCVVGCPYAPERSELAIDVPRLMLRIAEERRLPFELKVPSYEETGDAAGRPVQRVENGEDLFRDLEH